MPCFVTKTQWTRKTERASVRPANNGLGGKLPLTQMLDGIERARHNSNTTVMQTLARIIGALALLAITGFCVFGFMAIFEYSETAKRLPWQIGYGALGFVCLSGAVMLLRPRRSSSTPSSTDTSR